MSELNTLITHMQNKDHFEMLGDLSGKLSRLSEEVDVIHHCFEGTAESRREVARLLVESHILNVVLQNKLSVMSGEWNKVMEATVAEMLKEYANFNEMEF